MKRLPTPLRHPHSPSSTAATSCPAPPAAAAGSGSHDGTPPPGSANLAASSDPGSGNSVDWRVKRAACRTNSAASSGLAALRRLLLGQQLLNERRADSVKPAHIYRDIYTGAGEDNGIDHDRNQLRFPYDSTGLRSHDLHPHPYLPSSFPTRCLGAADKERGAGAARHRCSSPHGRRMPAARPSTEPIAPRSWRLALAVVTRRPELHSERRLAASPGIHTALASDRASSEKIPAMSSGGRGFFRPDRWQHR
jgi:hypothetical protein